MYWPRQNDRCIVEKNCQTGSNIKWMFGCLSSNWPKSKHKFAHLKASNKLQKDFLPVNPRHPAFHKTDDQFNTFADRKSSLQAANCDRFSFPFLYFPFLSFS